MWFKKGELDEQMAQQPPPKEGEERPEDTRGIDERYQDDGTLSAEDRKKHSLRTGATQMMQAMKVAPPGGQQRREHMSASDIAKEFQTGRKWLWVVILVGLAAAAAVTIFLVRN